MPARTTTLAMGTTKPLPAKRFELPALEFKFGSLTEGTDIPPPLPSPVKEVAAPSDLSKPTDEKLADSNGTRDSTSKTDASATNGTAAANGGTKRPADDSPLSPALSSRQGSIRRLFSRNLLNNAYTDGEPVTNGNGVAHSSRPESRTGSMLDDKKAKRGSGWFRRLRGNDATQKRSSLLYEEVSKKQQQPTGPPPPMIPELADLEAKVDPKNEGSLGNDLFKDIKI